MNKATSVLRRPPHPTRASLPIESGDLPQRESYPFDAAAVPSAATKSKKRLGQYRPRCSSTGQYWHNAGPVRQGARNDWASTGRVETAPGSTGAVLSQFGNERGTTGPVLAQWQQYCAVMPVLCSTGTVLGQCWASAQQALGQYCCAAGHTLAQY
jgi:hypothetical protein